MNFKMYTFFATVLLFFLPAMAQKVLTVDESIDLALEQNLNLRSLRKDVEASTMKVKEAYTAFLPQVSVASTYTRAEIPDVQVNIPLTNPLTGAPMVQHAGVQTVPNEQYDTRLQVALPIFLGGRQLKGVTMAQMEKDLKAIQLGGEKKNVVYQVKALYYNLLKLQEAAKISDENVVLTQGHLDQARNFFDKGVFTKSQVLSMEVQVKEAEQAALEAHHQFDLARLSFGNLLNLDPAMVFSLLPVEKLPPDETITQDEVIKEALAQRAELRQLTKAVELSQEALGMAKTQFVPTITAIYNYGWREEKYEFSPGNHYWMFIGDFEWNLFSGGNDYYKVKEANYSKEKAESDLENVKRMVSLSASQAYLNWDQAKKNLAVATERQKSAEENYAMVAKSFEQGVVNELTEKDARLGLNSAKMSLAMATYDILITRAQLDNAMGVAEWSSPEVKKETKE